VVELCKRYNGSCAENGKGGWKCASTSNVNQVRPSANAVFTNTPNTGAVVPKAATFATAATTALPAATNWATTALPAATNWGANYGVGYGYPYSRVATVANATAVPAATNWGANYGVGYGSNYGLGYGYPYGMGYAGARVATVANATVVPAATTNWGYGSYGMGYGYAPVAAAAAAPVVASGINRVYPTTTTTTAATIAAPATNWGAASAYNYPGYTWGR
jgi:hypothetical protein